MCFHPKLHYFQPDLVELELEVEVVVASTLYDASGDEYQYSEGRENRLVPG